MKLSAFRNPKPIAAIALIALASLVALALFPTSPIAQAQQPSPDTPTPAPETDLDFPPPDAKKPPLGNLDSMLSRLVERVEQGISTANAAAASAPISRGESIAVTFYTQGDAATLADFLRANGGDPRNIGEGYVEAYAPISLLVRASEQPGVTSVNAIVPPQPAGDMPLSPDSLDTQNAAAGRGSVVSQGVALHGADAWHTAGYTGAGVKVGIIHSFGFPGFSDLMGSELPANVTARCYTAVGKFSSNLADCEPGESSYGAFYAQTLMDIAPDATLYISDPVSRDDMKDTVDWMVSQDVDVISYSTTWTWDGPGDGTSLSSDSPLKSVDAAVNGGIMFTSAVGNYARRAWQGQFTDTDGDGWLNYVGIDELNLIEIAADERVTIQLRWEDSWTAADTDINLVLYNADDLDNLVFADSAIDTQAGLSGDRPYERLIYTSPTGGTYGIAIHHRAGPAPAGWVQLLSWSRDNIAHYTESGGIGNPAESANPGLLAVGAARWWDTNIIAWYSSRGPAPDGRTKPDIMGASCTQAAGRQAINLSNGQQCWIGGTGVASAHIAGLAALVKDAYPAYTPQQIADYLKTNAQPRGAKPNNDWGHGFAKLPAPPQTTAPVGGDLAGRVGALEQQMGALQRLMLNIQSLLQALHNRLDSLEQGGGVAPTATPTPTATATPSPTPTRVSRPAPTPVSSDACVQPIGDPYFTSSYGTSFYGIGGTWTTACITANPPNRDSDTRYAKFYTFAVSAEAEVSITLTSDEPNYLYLLSGAGRRGAIMQRVGDTPSWTNTITATLQPGSYTIEATTYYPRVTDLFTLVMTIDTGDPGYQFYPPSPTPTPLAAACIQPIEPGSTSGAWTPACVSVSRGDTYYAKFYTFTLTQASTVTITLTSEDEPDTYLYLLEGAGGDGAVLHKNDDIDTAGGNYGSRIYASLPAGSYTIEATTNYRNVTGNFTLELSVRR